MEIKEVNEFIEEELDRLNEYYKDKNKDELTMAIGFKIIEELGELFKEMLSHKEYQRKDKLDKLDRQNLEKEFADVIISVLIMAKKFDVDVEKAIKIKMAEIKGRVYTN
ncbi:MAG: hypothetical protein AABX07_04725 [Nanoarchaeota archaeon]